MELWIAVSFALAFALTNGLHDAANAIATLVATRGAAPGPAIALSAVFNMLGALLVGTAVADTIAGIVTVDAGQAIAVIGSGAFAAVLWNLLTWWLGLPSSSSHALIGGLCGAALASAHNNWSVIKWSVQNPVTHHMQGLYHKVVMPMFVSPVCGTLVGSLLPLLFARLGWDPALMSAPFVTVIVDILGIVVYMNVALLMLKELS